MNELGLFILYICILPIGFIFSMTLLLSTPVFGIVFAICLMLDRLIHPPKLWLKASALTICTLGLFTVIGLITGYWSILVFALMFFLMGFAGVLHKLFRSSLNLSFKVVALIGLLGLMASWVVLFYIIDNSVGHDSEYAFGFLSGAWVTAWGVVATVLFVLIPVAKRIISRWIDKPGKKSNRTTSC